MKTHLSVLILMLTLVLSAFGCSTAVQTWEQTEKENTISAYEEFLQQYGTSEFAQEARSRIKKLETERAWKVADSLDNLKRYETFLEFHSSSKYAPEAKRRIAERREEQAWKAADLGEIVRYEMYLRTHSESKYSAQARAKLEALYARRDWEKARATDDVRSYEEFLREHPNSRYTEMGKSRLELVRQYLPGWQEAQRIATSKAYREYAERNPLSPYAERAWAIAADQAADRKGRDIVDALRSGKVEANVTGNGIKEVHMTIRRSVKHAVKVVIPVGSYFKCRGSAQNMVSRAEKFVDLTDDAWTSILIPAACANRTRAIPDGHETFDIMDSPGQADLRRLMPVLQKAGASFGVEQAAVWIVTDNADYADMGTLLNRFIGKTYGETRVIQEHETARALKLCDEARIDITQRAVWRDRGRILKGLKDPALKKWLAGKN